MLLKDLCITTDCILDVIKFHVENIEFQRHLKYSTLQPRVLGATHDIAYALCRERLVRITQSFLKCV